MKPSPKSPSPSPKSPSPSPKSPSPSPKSPSSESEVRPTVLSSSSLSAWTTSSSSSWGAPSSSSRLLNAARWLELDAEVLQAETPEQFRLMLAKIASAANLKASQIAVKSGIPRSQAYAMMKPSSVVPSKPNQIEAFLRVCNVAPEQVAEVMEMWAQLHAEATAKFPSDEAGPTTQSSMLAINSNTVSGSVGGQVPYGDVVIHNTPGSPASDLVGLLRYVVADERRTNRAMRLLSRVVTLQLPPLMFFLLLLTHLPQSVTVWVAAVLSVLLLAAVLVGVIKFRQMLRRVRRETDQHRG